MTDNNPLAAASAVIKEVLRRPIQFDEVIPIERKRRESGLDETLAETFPCSDPLSSIPDPLDLAR